jgi:hypothetical protein
MNVFMAGAFRQVLGMINSLQLLVHMPIINVVFPANAIAMFQVLAPIVMFDILDKLDLLVPYFPLSIEDADRTMEEFRQMQDIGYDSFNIFMNLGTLSFLVGLYICKVVTTMLLLKPLSVKFPNWK